MTGALRRGAGACLCLLAAATAIAGCGTSEEVRFRKEQFRPVQTRIDRERSTLSAELQSVRLGRRRDARLIRSRVNRLSAEIGRLSTLNPPDSVADELARYIGASHRLVGALRRFAALLAQRNPGRLERAANDARDAAGAVQRTRNDLDVLLAGE